MGWDDQHRNPNMNNKDHLVGQLTKVDNPMVDIAKELNNETSAKVAGAHEKTGGARVHLNQW